MAQKILYIEDNLLNLRLVRRMVMPDGYVLMDAQDGEHGVMMASKVKPDLILLDMNLPDMHGLETLKMLKEKPETAKIPIIAITANAMVGDRDYYLAAGCDGYIAKPISRKELLNVIAYFVNRDVLNKRKFALARA